MSLLELLIYPIIIIVNGLKWIRVNCPHYCWLLLNASMQIIFATTPTYSEIFDSTLGYPGEGWGSGCSRGKKRGSRKWSNSFENLTMATWNTRSMTVERFTYCKNLGYDILAVTELWRNQDKFTSRSDEFIVSANARDNHGNLINGNDAAAGAGIILSQRAQSKVMAKGNNNSERICWVRLKGPVCNHLCSCRLYASQLSGQPITG